MIHLRELKHTQEIFELFGNTPMFLNPDLAGGYFDTLDTSDSKQDPMPVIQFNAEGGMKPQLGIIPVKGILTKDKSWRGSTYNGISQAIATAKSDPSIKAVLLHIDSPGGSAVGCDQVAQEVAALADEKPVIAFCDGLCASAAYYIASSASEIWAPKDAFVGCIGTYMVAFEAVGLMEKWGIKAHMFSSGSMKGAGSFGTEFTDDHKAAWQRDVDALSAMFFGHVESSRDGADMESVKTGDCWLAESAASYGLVDRIGSEDQCLAEVHSICEKLSRW